MRAARQVTVRRVAEDGEDRGPINAAEFTRSSTAIGAGGTYTFQLLAKSAGRSDLTLLYRRSWETGVAPLQTYHVTIVFSRHEFLSHPDGEGNGRDDAIA